MDNQLKLILKDCISGFSFLSGIYSEFFDSLSNSTTIFGRALFDFSIAGDLYSLNDPALIISQTPKLFFLFILPIIALKGDSRLVWLSFFIIGLPPLLLAKLLPCRLFNPGLKKPDLNLGDEILSGSGVFVFKNGVGEHTDPASAFIKNTSLK